ncbi:hypothetical protein TD95_000739 [Thielaviopsis punctulata]|uniref:MARVEL domain-containing protein n=1 Tax=Thielaviopsis punctulata TaxID=72032 RepID=A0A0F4ZLX5_9PEZI|nr:hypothetical protein TD95_000739 [Thielaviopsis punctulata]
MVATMTSGSYATHTTRRVVSHHHSYRWPGLLFNLWVLIMMMSACAVLGILGNFVMIQHQLLLGIPWYFPYFMTVASLTIIFIFMLIGLTWQRRLLPAIVMVGGFMLLVMWAVGMVRVSIELWGSGNVNSQCSIQVWSGNPKGENIITLAWLMQKSICQSWQALFSFSLVGTAALIWIMIMSYQVFAAS